MLIYLLQHPHGFYYVGRCDKERYNNGYRGGGSLLNAFRKNSPYKFKSTVIVDGLDDNTAKAYEAFFVNCMTVEDPTSLNLALGGKGSHPYYRNSSVSFKNAMSESHKRKTQRRLGTGRHYIITDPCGVEHYVDQIVVWCKLRNLSASNLQRVAKGNRKHHKQHTARYAE